MGNYFCKFSFNMPAIFSIQIRVKFELFSNIFLTSSMFSSEGAVLRLPEFSLFLLTLVPSEQYFITFC